MSKTTRKKASDVWAEEEETAPNSTFNNAVEEARKLAGPASPGTPEIEVTNAVAATVAPAAPVIQQAPKPTELPDSQNSSKPEKQKPDRSGEGYIKTTHRIRDDAFQALEDMKLLLKRQYGFKRILLEEIVEEALLGAKRDLDEHQEQSFLVQRLRDQKLPESQ